LEDESLAELEETIVASLQFPAVRLTVKVQAAVLPVAVPPQRPDVFEWPRLAWGRGRYVGE
jgi:hypothetical protein